MALNERGDVVGFSNVSKADGANFNARAFLWTRGRGIQDLGTLPGDSLSQALGINEQRQIVGISCTAGFASCRAFLWEHGVMMDLNDFVPDDYADHLYTANDINNLGQITGYTVKAGTEDSLAFWALPLEKRGHRDSNADSSCSEERCEARAAARASTAAGARSRGRDGGAARAVTIE